MTRPGSPYRIGLGIDAHRFAPGRALVLGGVRLREHDGLLGHSDADVLTHAIMDALLGAAGLDDVGRLFPDDDPAFAGADSLELLASVTRLLRHGGWQPVNVDAVVVCEEPRIAPHRTEMRERLAAAMGVAIEQVTLRGTTTEGLGFTGRREGIAAQAVALVEQTTTEERPAQ
ncbi:MAG: 2-C-methyl-D-erythritol 2,4-cyclodiphosphate synthase [Actinobacteria bacterium RBG_16_64_13]|nr:MAG: 2-C-methyl-D-erythritol 2,4-cyclodiphosphate synthase [Actinobacteria bacterium RBG_16_64_13]